MSLMMPVFKRSQLGTVTHKTIGVEHWGYYQSQGWHDAPEKVPLNPGQQAEPVPPEPVYSPSVKPYGAFGTVHGEIPTEPQRKRGAQPGNQNARGRRRA